MKKRVSSVLCVRDLGRRLKSAISRTVILGLWIGFWHCTGWHSHSWQTGRSQGGGAGGGGREKTEVWRGVSDFWTFPLLYILTELLMPQRYRQCQLIRWSVSVIWSLSQALLKHRLCAPCIPDGSESIGKCLTWSWKKTEFSSLESYYEMSSITRPLKMSEQQTVVSSMPWN